MTKDDLIARIAEEAGITRKAADLVLKAFVGAIHDSLKGIDASIRVPDLGTFKVSQRKARIGVNPGTGDKIQIAAASVPSFVASKALKSSAKE